VLDLVRQRKNYRFARQDKLRIELKLPDIKARVAAIREAFGELA